MAYTDGWAAIHMNMPQRVPRTEYSADFHWELIKKVTGIDAVTNEALRPQATQAFLKAWDYGYSWNILIGENEFKDNCNTMGHAVYQADGSDFTKDIKLRYHDEDDVYAFDPFKILGQPDEAALLRRFNASYQEELETKPDCVTMTGTYVTLMSGLIGLFGWDLLLLAAGCDEDEFGAMANRYADWMMHYMRALARCDAPVVMIHDDIVWTEGAFLNPSWYRKYLFPNYVRYFEVLKNAGKTILYTSDGNVTEFFDDIAPIGVDGMVFEPLSDMGLFAQKYGTTHSFTGNFDTRILLSGTRDDIEREVKRCMEIGKRYPGFIMAVGNHIPPNTPVDNCLWYNDLYMKHRER